ncbi:unnamed protein product, partial [Polarella glacialis]
VRSYDGGSQRGRAQYDVRHVLTPLVDPYHSSACGAKFNLVLESSEDFTLTHVFVSGPGARCLEPVRSGIIWVSDTVPSVEESKRYDCMTEEELQEAVKAAAYGVGSDPNLPGPCVYFTTDATTREVEIELPKWVEGKYVLVKLLDTHGRQDHLEVGVVAFVGFSGRRAAEQVPLGPWMRRSVRQSKVHPNTLKSMFSNGGWVCDGRDVPGGCRSGMTDFHQTSVYTMTFRCPATGFDLCEACAFDADLGQVTKETVCADIEALRDPTRCRLACSRIRNLLKRNFLATLPDFVEGGLLDVLSSVLSRTPLPVAKSSGGEEGSDDGPMGGGSEASRRPEEDPSDQSAGQSANPPLAVGTRVEARYLLSSGRMTSRFYPGRVAGQNEDGTYQVEYDDGDKWYNVPQEVIVVTSGAAPATPGSQAAEVAKNTHRQSLRSVTLELAQRLFSRFPSHLSVGDQVWARRGSERWEDGRLLALPSPLVKIQEASPGSPQIISGETAEGAGYLVAWKDGRQSSWVQPSDVLKATAGGRGAMGATVGLFAEVAKGPACDQAALTRHLTRNADLAAVSGAGYPVLLLAVRAGAPIDVLSLLLESGACIESSGPFGMTPLEQACSIKEEASEGSFERQAAEKAEELLVSRGNLLRPKPNEEHSAERAELRFPPREQLRRLGEAFGRQLLGAVLTSHATSAMPTELLEVVGLLIQGLELEVVLECLQPVALRSLLGLLQHFVGGTDGVKTVLMGCRICRALLLRKEAKLVHLVQSHGVLRWARWLASRKPT